MARQLSRKLAPLLETEQLDAVNRDFELPLIDVLADIERAGIRVDTAALAQQGAQLENQLAALTVAHLTSWPAASSTSARRSSSARCSSSGSTCRSLKKTGEHAVGVDRASKCSRSWRSPTSCRS